MDGVFPTGVEEGLQPMAVADDNLEKTNPLGGADDKVDRMSKQASGEGVKDSEKDQATLKKSRFIWTREVHNRFLDAVKQIGFDRAVPTKILELMQVEDLTRENVASHLQKYRLQLKRRDKERAQARAASENVLKGGVYPHMSGIPQQPWVLPNKMQGINMECACLDGSQIAPSFAYHNSDMIQAFPTVQEVYGNPYKDLFDESVNRMSSVRLVHGLYDSNGPHDINKIGYNFGQLPQKPLVDSYAHNPMGHHDTTLVPQYDRRDELSLQGIISPFQKPLVDSYSHNLMDHHDTTLVPQYDRRDELSLQGIINPFAPQYDQQDELSLHGIISPSFVSQYDRRDELSLRGIISPSFVPQYDRRNELFVADQGIISPLMAQNMEGLGVGVPRPPKAIGGLIGMKVEGIEVGMPRPPTGVLGMKIERLGQGVQRLPESNRIKVEGHGVGVHHPPTGGLVGMNVKGLGLAMPRLPEATGGLTGMKVEGHVPRLPEETGGLARMKVEGHVPRLPEATGCFAGMKVEGHVPHLPEATGGFTGMKVEGHLPRLPEAIGGLAVEAHGAGVTHLPEATGGPELGFPWLSEASGGLVGTTAFQSGFPFTEDLESPLHFNDFQRNIKRNDFDDLPW